MYKWIQPGYEFQETQKNYWSPVYQTNLQTSDKSKQIPFPWHTHINGQLFQNCACGVPNLPKWIMQFVFVQVNITYITFWELDYLLMLL